MLQIRVFLLKFANSVQIDTNSITQTTSNYSFSGAFSLYKALYIIHKNRNTRNLL